MGFVYLLVECLLLVHAIKLCHKDHQMIVNSKETKAQASLIDLLGGTTKTKNSNVSDVFANLLNSLKLPINNEKKFNVLIDSKSTLSQNTPHVLENTKGLKSTDALKLGAKTLEDLLGNEETKLLPKELIDVLSNDQVRSLINKAKEFLKESINTKVPEYNTGSRELPNTLMGLVELADKLGINLSEITLSILDDDTKTLTKGLPEALAAKSFIELKQPTPSAEIPSQSFEKLGHLLSQIKQELKDEAKSNLNLLSEESHSQKSQPLQSLLRSLNDTASTTPTLTSNLEPLPKESTITSKEASKTTTAIDMLGALLRSSNEIENGDKEAAKLIDEPTKTIQTAKADSLEVKTKEAAQTMRHFAIDLKEAAENYKPPFTRVTMKLNPEKLGEVEVTLVQRGNNVHVNIQSNNNASVAFLAHNATELKAQLAHQGITNATMNFMSGGENQSQNPQHQHQQHNRFKAYESLQELESAQQELSALEIILPHYA